jgi:hypothetical protein
MRTSDDSVHPQNDKKRFFSNQISSMLFRNLYLFFSSSHAFSFYGTSLGFFSKFSSDQKLFSTFITLKTIKLFERNFNFKEYNDEYNKLQKFYFSYKQKSSLRKNKETIAFAIDLLSFESY